MKILVMRIIVTIVLIFLALNAFPQSSGEIEKLEEKLQFYNSSKKEFPSKCDIAYKLLDIDKYNQRAISFLLVSFHDRKLKDSISYFLDNLIEKNKNDVEPYLIREQYNSYEKSDYPFRINNLKKAFDVDSLETRVNTQLGKLYYELFIKDSVRSNLDLYATNSFQYFLRLYQMDDGYKEALKYPLIQLANYLEKNSELQIFESSKLQSSYFPILAFAGLPSDWKNNYSVNVFRCADRYECFGLDYAMFSISWYSSQLRALQEPVLNDSLPTQIFRFTYLRTFDNPIVIGLENKNDTILIYWKVSDGAGGYGPGNIIVNKSKTLTLKEWEDFTEKNEYFWSLPTLKNDSGFDGSQWILEGKRIGQYHVVDRWCGGDIKKICKYLIELTGLKIKRIY